MFFSINTQCLYPNMNIEEAFLHLKKKGFSGVEDWCIPSEEIAFRGEILKKYQMRLTAFCPDFFILNNVDLHGEYKKHLIVALENAKILGAKALITQVGNDTGAPRQQQFEAIVQGLKEMAPLLDEADVTLLVEPLNSVKDHPGYFLTDSQEGFEVIKKVNHPKVKLLFDIYHQLHMGEDVLMQIEKNVDLIGHFHVAGFPNRDEKIFEDFDYDGIFKRLALLKNTVPVGIELFPSSQKAADELLEKLLVYV